MIRQIAERLLCKGHEITIATSCHFARGHDVYVSGVRVVSFPISGNLSKGIVGPIKSYQQFVIDGNYDAILIKAAQQWTFDALTPVLSKITGRKIFIPCGFSGLYQNSYRAYYSQMPKWLAAFDVLIFYASNYRDINFAKEHGLKSIVFLPNGANEKEFDGLPAPLFRNRFEIDKEDLLLLTVGSLNGAKGHWEVARAFELAHLNRPATLILNGNLPQRSRKGRVRQFLRELFHGRLPLRLLIKKTNSLNKGKKRIILCDLPRQDLVDAFKSSDLFVFASHIEYSPLVLFESVAAGTPFLSVPVGNAEEIATWTGGGVICPSPIDCYGRVRPNPLFLAREIEYLLGDKNSLRRLGMIARNSFIKKGFSWDSIVNQYEEILCGN